MTVTRIIRPLDRVILNARHVSVVQDASEMRLAILADNTSVNVTLDQQQVRDLARSLRELARQRRSLVYEA
jgi:hypothetical protein